MGAGAFLAWLGMRWLFGNEWATFHKSTFPYRHFTNSVH